MQAQFSQMRPIAIAPSMAPRVPIYPPGAPGLGQQFLYGQAPPALIPPQVITLNYFLHIYPPPSFVKCLCSLFRLKF